MRGGTARMLECKILISVRVVDHPECQTVMSSMYTLTVEQPYVTILPLIDPAISGLPF